MAETFPDDPDFERENAYRFDEIGPDRFRSRPIPSGLLRLYGGFIISQALATMQLTVPEGKEAHSLHLYFQRPGLTDRPLTFDVARETDGRSFSQRRVAVRQDGEPVASAMASFQAAEDGPTQQVGMPDVPAPDDLEPLTALLARQIDSVPLRHRPFWCRRQQFDWRPVEPFLIGVKSVRPARRHVWFRANAPVDGPIRVQNRLLAYASDTILMQTGLLPLGMDWADDYLQTSSLDHAMWFHAPFRVDEWLLYVLDSPVASGAKVLCTGMVFRQDGVLVATTIQQGLAREVSTRREGKI